jgi:hypothetical protein
VFINVATKNFNGDVDIFADNGSRTLSKIVVYADLAENETGRVIYLRKPERLLLRIQGRSPGDDPASFRIKFAGSFVASKAPDVPAEPEVPKATVKDETGIRVNSVGTIIAVTPKEKPVKRTDDRQAGEPRESSKPTVADRSADEKKAEPAKPVEVVVTEPAEPKTAEITKPKEKPAKVPARSRTARRSTPPAVPSKRTAKVPSPAAEPAAPTVDPLANIHLVIQFKDGRSIERPMTEVFKFSVDKGVLTVISKDGSIGKYSILDVEKVTIQ